MIFYCISIFWSLIIVYDKRNFNISINKFQLLCVFHTKFLFRVHCALSCSNVDAFTRNFTTQHKWLFFLYLLKSKLFAFKYLSNGKQKKKFRYLLLIQCKRISWKRQVIFITLPMSPLLFFLVVNGLPRASMRNVNKRVAMNKYLWKTNLSCTRSLINITWSKLYFNI